MKRKYFGTDGVRGRFGGDLMNPEFARRLGCAAGRFLAERGGPQGRPVVIGRDTRESGPALEEGLVRGFTEAGVEVLTLGVAPTPAVAMAVLHFRAALGVVVTASHNPADDNGIKFFSEEGAKLPDSWELGIERLLDDPDSGSPPAENGGRREVSGLDFYETRMAGILPPGSLQGWSLVLDTAHGAAYRTARAALESSGARLHSIGDAPDGRNINDGAGSQHPERMAARVRADGAALGLALDGDGDRIVLADETGSVLPGDAVLAILGLEALGRGVLARNTLVATVQSNLGLDEALRGAGGRVERTDVGDRNVLARMAEGGFNLGGESSGHIIFGDISPAGDGLLAALQVIEVMRRTSRSLSELAQSYRPFPQSSAAIGVREKPELSTLPCLTSAIREAEASLGEAGRVLVRYSGTEPKIRLLVEGRERAEVERWLAALREALSADGLC